MVFVTNLSYVNLRSLFRTLILIKLGVDEFQTPDLVVVAAPSAYCLQSSTKSTQKNNRVFPDPSPNPPVPKWGESPASFVVYKVSRWTTPSRFRRGNSSGMGIVVVPKE